jgi:hypothetical protein
MSFSVLCSIKSTVQLLPSGAENSLTRGGGGGGFIGNLSSLVSTIPLSRTSTNNFFIELSYIVSVECREFF